MQRKKKMGAQSSAPASYTRNASHAGSWYSNDAKELDAELSDWMISEIDGPKTDRIRAVICPHAGFRYSGRTAAAVYGIIDAESFHTIIVLGPSHHAHLRKCAISGASIWVTPQGNLEVDNDLRDRLLTTGEFNLLDQQTDEDEHSLEMHMPFVSLITRNTHAKILPILVGEVSPSSEVTYATILNPYLNDPSILFIVSSDFCHWGSRFQYTPTSPDMPIHSFIKSMDHDGMKLIEDGDADGFRSYLEETGNTICGRNPILILLRMMTMSTGKRMKFLKYDQSSAALNMRDSSVSYAAGVLSIE